MTEELAATAESKDRSKSWLAALPVCLVFGVLVLSPILDHFDNTTEIFPTHNVMSTATLIIAGACSLVGILFAVWIWRKLNVWRVVMAAAGCALIGFLFSFLLVNYGTDLWFAWRDFPKAETRTYLAEIPISRAYATHGKSASYNIQTMPFWSNMDITEHDYAFMQAHRSPADTKRDPDEIRSKGYFCARVSIEANSYAVRVLHAGRTKLPENTVFVCQSTGTMIRVIPAR